MTYRFEKLEVWQRARKFTVDIYTVSSRFPKIELFGLTSQLRRASLSIALNIAEGSDRKSDKDFIRFLRISIGTTEEVVTALYIAKDLNYIDERTFSKLYEESNVIVAKLNSLIKTLLIRR